MIVWSNIYFLVSACSKPWCSALLRPTPPPFSASRHDLFCSGFFALLPSLPLLIRVYTVQRDPLCTNSLSKTAIVVSSSSVACTSQSSRYFWCQTLQEATYVVSRGINFYLTIKINPPRQEPRPLHGVVISCQPLRFSFVLDWDYSWN